MAKRCKDCQSSYRMQTYGGDPPENGALMCLGARYVPPPHWRHGREYKKGDPPMLHLILDEGEAEQCPAFNDLDAAQNAVRVAREAVGE